MKIYKVPTFILALSIFLSVGVGASDANAIRPALALPAGSSSGSISNGYNFCLGVDLATTAVVDVKCNSRANWSSTKSSRSGGYNLLIEGRCLTAPALKNGQDLSLSACGTSSATQWRHRFG